MSDFFDAETFQELAERVSDAHTGLGLTVTLQQSQIDPKSGEIYIITMALVRPTAYKNMTEDIETRKAVQRIAADEAQTALDEKVNKYKQAIEEGRILDVLTGKDSLVHCDHANIHEGLCLDCHEEIPREDPFDET